MPSSTSASSQQLTLSSEEIQESPRKYFGFSTEEIENTSDLSFDSSEVSFDSSEVSFDSSEEIPITSLDIFYFPANYSEILPEESYQAPNASISRAEISHETTISLDISLIFALGRIFRSLH